MGYILFIVWLFAYGYIFNEIYSTTTHHLSVSENKNELLIINLFAIFIIPFIIPIIIGFLCSSLEYLFYYYTYDSAPRDFILLNSVILFSVFGFAISIVASIIIIFGDRDYNKNVAMKALYLPIIFIVIFILLKSNFWLKIKTIL